MKLEAPQITYLVVSIIFTAVHILNTGKKYRWNSFLLAPVSAVSYSCLALGGFFRSIEAPQVISLVLLAVSILGYLLVHGTEQRYLSIKAAVFNLIACVGLCYWGGFFG